MSSSSSKYSSNFQGLLNAGSLPNFMGLLSQYFPQYAGQISQTQTPTPPAQGGQSGYQPFQWGQTPEQFQGVMAGLPMTPAPVSTATPAFKTAYDALTKDLYSTAKKK